MAEPPFGYAWRGLDHIIQRLGADDQRWDGEALLVSNSQHRLRFYPGRRKAELDGTVFWLNAPADGSASQYDWQLAGIDVDLINLALLAQDETPVQPMLILLDPGHGGLDAGAQSLEPSVLEKDLTLTLAKEIGSRLKQAGMRVLYTRESDKTVELNERVAMARHKKVDLFISIHANHAPNSEATGVETYVLTPSGYPGTAQGSRARGWQVGNRNDYQNTLLGFSIHRLLASETHTVDRGLKRQSFFVLRETGCPAVLLEVGFLSNSKETQRMLTQDWQASRAQAVADGILNYSRKVSVLERAVAKKHALDAERNERWQRHLSETAAAAEVAQAPTPLPAPVLATVTPPVVPLIAEHTSTPLPVPVLATVTPPVAPLVAEHPSPSSTKTAVLPQAPTESFQSPPDVHEQYKTDEYKANRLIARTATHPVVQRGTNVAPVEINSLIDFYETGSIE